MWKKQLLLSAVYISLVTPVFANDQVTGGPDNDLPASGGGAAGVQSFMTRTGSVTLLSADVITALGFTPLSSTGPVLNSPTINGIISGSPTFAGGGVVTVSALLAIAGNATLASGKTLTSSGTITGGIVTAAVTSSTLIPTGTGAVSRTLQAKNTDGLISALDYGLPAANAINCTPATIAITAGSTTLTTSGECAFVVGDVAKNIFVPGAGAVDVRGTLNSVAVTTGGTFSGTPMISINDASANKGPYTTGGTDAALTPVIAVTSVLTINSAGTGCTNGTAQVFTLVGGPTGSTSAQVTGTVVGGALTSITSVSTPGSYLGIVPGNYNGGTITLSGDACPTPPVITPLYTLASVVVPLGGVSWSTGATATFNAGGTVSVAPTFGAVGITATTLGEQTTIASVTNAGTIVLAAAATTTINKTGSTGNVIYGTDASAAINNTQTAARAVAGNRGILVPAGGGAYYMKTPISFGNGVLLTGLCVTNFSGAAVSDSTSAQFGTWFQQADDTNPMFKMGGHGSALECVNFVSSQPVPSVGWTPLDFPYRIAISGASNVRIEHIRDLGGSRVIVYDYSQASGGGNGDLLNDFFISPLRVGISVHNSNSDQIITNGKIGPLAWYSSNTSLVTWTEANLIGILSGYFDNYNISNLEVYKTLVGFEYFNGFVQGNAHSAVQATAVGIQCNLVTQCIKIVDAGTLLSANFSNMSGQVVGTSPYIDVQGGAVKLNLSGITVGPTGGAIIVAGDGDTTGQQSADIVWTGGYIGTSVGGAVGSWGSGGASTFATLNASGTLDLSVASPILRQAPSSTQRLTTGAGQLNYVPQGIPDHHVGVAAESYQVKLGVTWEDVQNTASIATWTTLMRQCFIDGDTLNFTFKFAVGTLTFTPFAGDSVQNAPASVVAGGKVNYRCNSSIPAWVAS